MTFETLAKLVADDFNRTMNEQGFETFDEMKHCYEWSAKDIKEEVAYTISEISQKRWEDTGSDSETAYMSDDCTMVVIGMFDEMSWREFKKLVFGLLK